MNKHIKTNIQDTIQKYMEQKHRKSALIIAHRGGAKSQDVIENTIEAFETAIDKQIKMVEFDVRRTKDNQFVIFHNNHIEKIKLNSLTYQELLTLASRDGYCVPLFHDVLKFCSNKIMLDIELKESGYEKEVIELLGHYYSTNQFIITSFIDSVIEEVKRINPQIKAGLLIGKDNASILERFSEIFPIKRLKKTGADFIVPNYLLVTPWLVRYCRKSQFNIYVWTVNGDSLYTKLIRKKVAGIITDYPERYDGKYITDSKEEYVC
jgi:Glycerophosphoryl diester phosphodiesterase